MWRRASARIVGIYLQAASSNIASSSTQKHLPITSASSLNAFPTISIANPTILSVLRRRSDARFGVGWRKLCVRRDFQITQSHSLQDPSSKTRQLRHPQGLTSGALRSVELTTIVSSNRSTKQSDRPKVRRARTPAKLNTLLFQISSM